MKNINKKAPRFETYLELNKRHGYGYQARLVMEGVIESIIDAEPFTLQEAYSGAVFAIEEINKETGYGYEPYKIIHITNEAIQANRKHDFFSARTAIDIEQGKGEMSVPEGADYQKKIIDGKEEIVFTGRGVILTAFFSWRDDKLPKAREASVHTVVIVFEFCICKESISSAGSAPD